MNNILLKFLSFQAVIKALQACDALLYIGWLIEQRPQNPHYRHMQKETYDFILQHIGPVDQFGAFYKAHGGEKPHVTHYMFWHVNTKKVKAVKRFYVAILVIKIIMLLVLLGFSLPLSTIYAKLVAVATWVWSTI